MSTYLTFVGLYQYECDESGCDFTACGTRETVRETREEHERSHATWEISPEHDGLQGVLLTDRNEQGTLL